MIWVDDYIHDENEMTNEQLFKQIGKNIIMFGEPIPNGDGYYLRIDDLTFFYFPTDKRIWFQDLSFHDYYDEYTIRDLIVLLEYYRKNYYPPKMKIELLLFYRIRYEEINRIEKLVMKKHGL